MIEPEDWLKNKGLVDLDGNMSSEITPINLFYNLQWWGCTILYRSPKLFGVTHTLTAYEVGNRVFFRNPIIFVCYENTALCKAWGIATISSLSESQMQTMFLHTSVPELGRQLDAGWDTFRKFLFLMNVKLIQKYEQRYDSYTKHHRTGQ